MNQSPFSPRRIACASLVAASLALATCGPAAVPVEPPLKGARIGGPFSLVGPNGQNVTDRDFAGEYRLIYFGYTFCPDVCPIDLNYLALGLKLFERQDPGLAAKIQPIFITVDPARDTPAILAAYVRQFHPRLIGLTGSPAQIKTVADAYVVQYATQAGTTPDDYIVGHTNIAYLMGPEGQPLAIVPVDDVRTEGVNEGSPDLVAAELARWVR